MSEPCSELVDAVHDLIDDPGSGCYTLIHWHDPDSTLSTNAPVAYELARRLAHRGFNVTALDRHRIDLSEESRAWPTEPSNSRT